VEPSKDVMCDHAKTMPLFSYGGEVATNATECRRASLRTESAGDFLLNLHHAEILFRAIVGKWHPEIGREPNWDENKSVIVRKR
jgi:hypothetical protein